MEYFWGFERKDGQAGSRNYIGVMASASCANDPARWIADRVEGCLPYGQMTACGDGELDTGIFYRTLINIGKNPNLAGVLVVGPDCECNDVDRIAAGISASGKPVEVVKLHMEGGAAGAVDRGIGIAQKMAAAARRMEREKIDISRLRLGLTCGGSTPISGVVTNAAMGSALDILIGKGGSGGFCETPEVIGAEHVLADRAKTGEVRKALLERVKRCEERFMKAGVNLMGSNPNPQNIADGLSTVEEKALGAIAKGGSTPLVQVCDYGEIPGKKGLFFVDSPGNDLISMTALVAAGCQVMVYSTESACPYAVPFVPVIKVTANREHFDHYSDFLDYRVKSDDAVKNLGEAGFSLFRHIVKVASGEKTKTEGSGYHGACRLWSVNPTT